MSIKELPIELPTLETRAVGIGKLLTNSLRLEIMTENRFWELVKLAVLGPMLDGSVVGKDRALERSDGLIVNSNPSVLAVGLMVNSNPSVLADGLMVNSNPSVLADWSMVISNPSVLADGSMVISKPSVLSDGSMVISNPSVLVDGSMVISNPSVLVGGRIVISNPSVLIVGSEISVEIEALVSPIMMLKFSSELLDAVDTLSCNDKSLDDSVGTPSSEVSLMLSVADSLEVGSSSLVDGNKFVTAGGSSLFEVVCDGNKADIAGGSSVIPDGKTFVSAEESSLDDEVETSVLVDEVSLLRDGNRAVTAGGSCLEVDVDTRVLVDERVLSFGGAK